MGPCLRVRRPLALRAASLRSRRRGAVSTAPPGHNRYLAANRRRTSKPYRRFL